MPLGPGTRLGPYELLSAIGAGGMGEVYKARDSRLNRSVAVKVLPPELAADPERRSRFEREAHAIAALSHPHICTIHDIGRDRDTDYIVMERLEGESLADRLERARAHPLPLPDVLRHAIEIAGALDKAHRAGIVHRDLKPGNIMLTKSGAKLLDFGLAKLKVPAVAISMTAIEHATTTGPKTASGTILGTVHYMAPEQVEGRDADARSDIWALGVVIYEMATGTRPFEGDSAASIISAILKDSPPAVSSRQPLSPAALDHVVQRCLTKDPDERWQSAGDVCHEIQWSANAPPSSAAVLAVHRRPSLLPWLIVAAALVVASWSTWSAFSPRPSPIVPERQLFSIALPPGVQIGGAAALLPDGSSFVFVGLSPDAPPSLWLQVLRTGSVQRLAGTEYASLPFWSPHNDFVGFFASGKLQIIPTAGGNAKVLAVAQNGRGASWGRDGTILYVPEPNSHVLRVSEKGGTATAATILNQSRGDIGHRWPTFVDDRRFLFSQQSAKTEVTGIYLGFLDGSAPLRLAPQYSNAVFHNGQVLYVLNGMIVAQQLDLVNNRLLGDPVEVAGPAAYSGGLGFESFSIASNGVLAYAPGSGTSATSEVHWVDRRNPSAAPTRLESHTDVSQYNAYFEQLAPDGQMLVISAFRTATADLWLLDVRRDVLSRFTFDDATELNPVWSPDGRELLFSSNRAGFYNIYRKAVSESSERLIARAESHQYATDWARDGRTILFTNTDPKTGADIWTMPLDDKGEATVVQRTSFNEYQGRLSPDQRWMAYTSDESGQPEIYVQRFPSGSDKSKVSAQGGSEPQWRADGRELFYLAADRTLVAAPVSLAPTLAVGRSSRVHSAIVDTSIGSMHGLHYTPMLDGQRFLVSVAAMGPSPTVVLNWQPRLHP